VARACSLALIASSCGGRSIRTDAGAGESAAGGTTDSVSEASGGRIEAGGSGGTSANGGGMTMDTSSTAGTLGAVTPGSGGTGTSACTVHGVRLSNGGNQGQLPTPPGACVLVNAYYCPGESYSIDSGPCTGTCTCADGSWSCSYDHPDAHGECSVNSCVDGNDMLDVGGAELEDDGCTVCRCTKQGLVCSGAGCDWKRACTELLNEYGVAVTAAAACDPTSTSPQCTEVVPAAPGCDISVPVHDRAPVDAVLSESSVLGCPVSPQICPPSAKGRQWRNLPAQRGLWHAPVSEAPNESVLKEPYAHPRRHERRRRLLRRGSAAPGRW
jgi:hypothetical protein